MTNKLVVKCGNFAVLVDLQVLPQGTSKDTSWFSDHEKEEVCTLVRETLDSRVKEYIDSRKQPGQLKRKEYTQASPLILKGNRLRIAAYFIKRWVKLRCVVKRQHRELHVFPDRFVVCASQLEPDSSMRGTEAAVKETNSSGTSEYFAEHKGNEMTNLVTTPTQAVLKNIVRKTKIPKDISDEAGRVSRISPSLGLADTGKANASDIQKALSKARPEEKRAEQANYYINTESSLELPVPEVENDVNDRQSSECAELKTQQELSKLLSRLSDSAKQTQSLQTTVVQQKRRRHSSEGESERCKKSCLTSDTFIRQSIPRNQAQVKDLKSVPVASWTHPVQHVSADSGNTLPSKPAAIISVANKQQLVCMDCSGVSEAGTSVLPVQHNRTLYFLGMQ
ncbi:SLX4 interacting protein [Xenopus laevis]|uniref:SLX4 interacting protein n=2 Tax=Xenopus laevis TaxID=8355 RepID=A0A8J0PTP7_XENLA|nr:SLX4 interacting protein [Xenopus laevis]